MEIKRAVGKYMKIVRQRRELMQDQLAERVGLSSKYISGIERGVESPTMDILIRVAKELEGELYDLFLFVESEESGKALRKGIEKKGLRRWCGKRIGSSFGCISMSRGTFSNSPEPQRGCNFQGHSGILQSHTSTEESDQRAVLTFDSKSDRITDRCRLFCYLCGYHR